jgi:hypothetical protein
MTEPNTIDKEIFIRALRELNGLRNKWLFRAEDMAYLLGENAKEVRLIQMLRRELGDAIEAAHHIAFGVDK